MNIRELMEILRNYPEDLEVMVDGYEGGYDDLRGSRVHSRHVKPVSKKVEWYGDYDKTDVGDKDAIQVLSLGRPHFKGYND